MPPPRSSRHKTNTKLCESNCEAEQRSVPFLFISHKFNVQLMFANSAHRLHMIEVTVNSNGQNKFSFSLRRTHQPNIVNYLFVVFALLFSDHASIYCAHLFLYLFLCNREKKSAKLSSQAQNAAHGKLKCRRYIVRTSFQPFYYIFNFFISFWCKTGWLANVRDSPQKSTNGATS